MKDFLKKLTAALIALILMLAVFTACSDKDIDDDDNDDDDDKPVKVEKIEWYADLESHWQLDENGNKKAEDKHNFKSDVCTACGAFIFDLGTGEKYFYMYDKYGAMKYIASIDESNNITDEQFAELKYNDNDILIYEKWTDASGKAISETNFKIIDGKNVIANDIFYFFDGSKEYTEYDDHGYSVKIEFYNEAGELLETTTFENQYDENGNRNYIKEYEEGILISESCFDNVKIEEDDYSYYEAVLIKGIYYENDGSKSVITYVNESPVEEINYDPSGVETGKTLYVNDDEGNAVSHKKYENGTLVEEVTYAMRSDGWGSYAQFITEYNSDGTKTVYEYDENYTAKSVTKYDANGKVIG